MFKKISAESLKTGTHSFKHQKAKKKLYQPKKLKVLYNLRTFIKNQFEKYVAKLIAKIY